MNKLFGEIQIKSQGDDMTFNSLSLVTLQDDPLPLPSSIIELLGIMLHQYLQTI